MRVRSRDYGANYGCPVEATLDIIGGKYKGVLLFHLAEGPKRFGELRRLVPGATQRMVTLQLRELEQDGVIHREVFREVPPRVEYSLTEFGASLEPILRLMRDWGEVYTEQIKAIKAEAAAAHPRDWSPTPTPTPAPRA